MVFKIADSIISPLGETTRENYLAVKAGRAKLCRYDHHWQIPEPFTASLLTEEQNQRLKIEGLTRFEAMAYHSIVGALRQTNLDVKAKNVVLMPLRTPLADTRALYRLAPDRRAEPTAEDRGTDQIRGDGIPLDSGSTQAD